MTAFLCGDNEFNIKNVKMDVAKKEGVGIIQLQMERGLVYSIPYFLCK